MPSSRQKRHEEEEDEEEEMDEHQKSVTAKDPEDDLSPPGMKLRSGRKKKRRRSKETTNDEETKKRRRVADENENDESTDEDDHDEEEDSEESEGEDKDSEMEDADDDENQDDDRKMPAEETNDREHAIPTNGSHRAAEGNGSIDQRESATRPPGQAKPASPKARAPKVSKLRLPSKHTPGKLKETRRLRPEQEDVDSQIPMPPSGRLVFDRAPATQTTMEDSKIDESQILENGDNPIPEDGQQQQALHLRVYQYVSDSVSLAAVTMTQMIVPEQVETAMDEAPIEDGEPSIAHVYFTRTPVWFAVFLLLQVLFWPLFIHPILSTVVDTSKVLLPHYKEYFGSNVTVPVPTPVVDKATEQKRAKELKDAQQKLEAEKKQKLAELAKLRDSFKREADALSKDLDSLQKEAAAAKTALAQQKGPFEAAAQRMAQIHKLLEQVSDEEDIVSSPLLPDIRKLLGADEALLVDVAAVELWDVSVGEGCEHFKKLDQILKRTALVASVREFKDLVDTEVHEIMESRESEENMRNWVLENGVSEAAQTVQKQVPAKKTRPSSGAGGASLDEIATLVKSRMEVESADQTGQVDYASLRNGASIIRTGDRATTPSLVDNLPVMNRMMSLLALRFYGYGPEAALTPTHPPTSLGQCWAFEPSPNNKYSGYGTLTVRLAEPVFVESVSIEHPPAEITDRVKTAVRNFRVIGFEDPDAEDKPWTLGSFEYDIQSDIRQEFEMEEENEDGDEIPVLHSISLAVDSNWGHEYACLYRFRVHGRAP